MEFLVPAEAWDRKKAALAAVLRDPADIPPLIVEWRSGTLSIRDGNHRAAAMQMAGRKHCWIIVWCNSQTDYEAAWATIGVADALPSPSTLSQHMRGLRGTAPILDLLIQSAARRYLDDWLGWDSIAHDGGQIAVRRAHNADRPRPPAWHIDGIGSGKNGNLRSAAPSRILRLWSAST